MKIKSILFSSIFVVLFMIVFPLLFAHLNNRFNLPFFVFGAGKTIGQLLVLVGIVVLFDCFRLIKKIGGRT